MSEIRQNVATKEWVIIATERAKRPEEFSNTKKGKIELPGYEAGCPFCPGNERMSPIETFSIREGDKWKVRVIPNKFPAVAPGSSLVNIEEGIVRSVSGVGLHEVIIETPEHNKTTALLPKEQVLNIIKAYKSRYLDIMQDEKIELVMFFKNHGERAGTSLQHPHSQMVATPIVPSYIRQRISDAMSYYDDHRECVFCRMVKEETGMGERIILENKSFVVFIPYAALSPFHTWIVPKRHMCSFPETNDAEMADFADILRAYLRKLYFGLEDPDFNYVIRSLPDCSGKNKFFHWYCSVIPRITRTAGFELGSGMYINVSLPESSAKFLREVKDGG